MLFWIHFCLFINIWSEIYKHCHFLFFNIIFVCLRPALVGQFLSLFLSTGGANGTFWVPLIPLLCDWRWSCFLHCDDINVHHKVLFPDFSSCHKTSKKELPNAWMPWTLTFLEEAAAQNYNMHEIGEQVIHYSATLPHHSDLSASRLHVKHIPYLSGIPLRQRRSRS